MALRRRVLSAKVPSLICLATVLAATAGAETPAWVHRIVCPMVGPFSKDSGPPGKTLDQILQDFRPEIAEWSVLPSLTDNPLCPKGIIGGLEYQEFPQSPERDLKLWLDHYGTPWEPTEDCGVAVPSSGKIADFKYGSDNPNSLYYMCHNSPRWHEFHRESILRAARAPNCALIRQDNIGVPSGVGWDNGGWCKWCLAGFRERVLRRFTSEQLRELGVADPEAFDPAAYLRARLDAKPEDLIENPLIREYTRFLLKSNLDAWQDEVDAAHAVRADLPICGNQGSGGLPPYPTVLLSDISDLVFLENSRRQWPDNGNSINYALALAGARHSKPAWIWDFGSPEAMEALDGSLLFVAECYANGATPYYEMNNLGHTAKKGYHAIALGAKAYEALGRYARFAHAQADLLTGGYSAEAPVALLYSVPSWAPKFCGAIRLGAGSIPAKAQIGHFLGFARALEHNHIPYNVEVLGDEELWPDRNLAERLARYRVLLCPNIEALADAQFEAMRQFVAAGGRVVVSGDFGTRDEGFARRPTPLSLEGLDESKSGRVIRLQDEPARFAAVEGTQESRGASQTVVLNQTEPRDLVVRGWSKAENVSRPADSHYSLWVDLTYQDGTPLWAQTASFKAGTHDWQLAELTIYPSKPLKSATVHALFRYHSGVVYFDDLFLGEVGSDTNLLKNPSFEGGDGKRVPDWEPFLGWQQIAAGYTPTTDTAHSGQQSLRCEIPKPEGESPAAAALARVFREALAGAGPQLETDAPSTVFVRPVRRDGQVVIHLLNLNYDDGQDRVEPTGDFRLAVPLPPGAAEVDGSVRLLTPDAEREQIVLPHSLRDGRVEVRVPELRIWSLVVFTAK